MAHRTFDEQMEALDALKEHELDEASVALIRKALAGKSNYLAAKAARLAEENSLADLVPDLLSAFDRFFLHGEKSDPQCWAKNAISRALPRLGCREKEVFLRGLHHVQLEPVWGGRSDTAATLRANCAHGLVSCEGLASDDLLLLLIDLLADPDKSARVEAVRAISQLSYLAVPVLRLRALIPGEDAEVIAACFNALLEIERESGIEFVSRFLDGRDDAAAEAAFALAETRTPVALAALMKARDTPAPAEPWFAGALLSAIALTRLPEGIEYLLSMIERDDREAPMAIESLCKASLSADLQERLRKVVESTGSPRLCKTLRENLPDPPRS